MFRQLVQLFVLSSIIGAASVMSEGGLREKLKELPDRTAELSQIENQNKANISEKIQILAQKHQQPFVFKLQYRHMAGLTEKGQSIPAGYVYVVHPQKAKPFRVEEPGFTQYIQDGKKLPRSTISQLNDLLED